MNKRSALKTAKAVKTSRGASVAKAAARKTAVRKSSPRPADAKSSSRPTAAKSSPRPAERKSEVITASLKIASVSVAQVVARAPTFRAHKFRVGQAVFYTSSPISRPGAGGSYKVVRLLPSDGDDYQYRIKNPGEAFERVAKESQLELEH